jgi:hypothetical protein
VTPDEWLTHPSLDVARGRLDKIAQMHQHTQMGGGIVSGYCSECDHVWPCPTYDWARPDSDRDPTLSAWDRQDEDADPAR